MAGTITVPSENVILLERFEGGGKPRVDRTAGIIYDVKVAGRFGQLGRRDYLEAQKKGGPSLYEGKFVGGNHPPEGQPASIFDRLGKIEGVRPQGEDFYGNFRYNPKHRDAEAMLWYAENMPEALVLSHRIKPLRIRNGGAGEMVEILEMTVKGLEFVTEPGMNKTLFESADMPGADSAQPDSPELTACIAKMVDAGSDPSHARDVCSATIKSPGSDEPAKPTQESLDMTAKTLAELSIDDLKKARPDLAKAILTEAQAEAEVSGKFKTLTEENTSLKQKLDAATAKDALADKKKACEKLCEEAKLPDELVTEVFVESLMAVDEKQRAALIEDRKLLRPSPGASSKNKTMGKQGGDMAESAKDDKGKSKAAAKAGSAGDEKLTKETMLECLDG